MAGVDPVTEDLRVVPVQTGEVPATAGSAVVVREQARAHRVAVERRLVDGEAQLAEATAELEQRRRQLEVEFAAQRAELEATIGPLRAQMDKLRETIWTVDLYLGRDEELEQIRHGSVAPAGTPLTVRQRVLAADEESLALVDQGGVDARSMDAFVGWVAASAENMTRVVPEAKCVVALVPSRQVRDLKDPWLQAVVEEANKQTYWLIRNGEQLWLMRTALVAGDRLLPTRDEFVDCFYATDAWTREKKPLEPGSEAWLKAEQRAGARRRHYMRLMLVLQGLVDRTAVFHPLPAGGVNLLDVAAQDEGKVRVVNELDLALTDGRESFRTWQRRLNAQLRPGLRVVCAVGRDFDALYEPGDRWRRGGHPRLAPPNASRPAGGQVQVLEEARDGGWVFRYARTDTVERRNVPVEGRPGWVHPVLDVPPSRRASCRVLPDDDWVLPYDLAAVEDLRYYLNSREHRGDYLSMVPVIRAALAAKEAEQAAEEPFRRLLADQLAAVHPDLKRDRVEVLLVDAVHRWKLGNRHHRALAAGDVRDLKAAAAIHADVAAVLSARTAGAGRVQAALATARAAFGAEVLVVTSKRDGTLHAYARHTDTGYGVGAGWLRELALGTTGRRPGRYREWQAVPAAAMSRRTIVWAAPDWDTFVPADPTVDLTGPQLADGVDLLRGYLADRGADPFAIAYRAKEDPYALEGRGLLGFALRRHVDQDQADTPAWDRGDELNTLVKRVTVSACATPRRRHGQLEWELSTRTQRWAHYSGATRAGTVELGTTGPWVDAANAYAGDPTRPRLVWHHEQTARRLAGLVAEHHDRERQRRAAADALWAKKRAALDSLERQRRALEETEAHTRFVEDYGTDAEDLWERHRQQVKPKPLPNWVDDLIRNQWTADDDEVSLVELAARAGQHTVDRLRDDQPLIAGLVLSVTSASPT